MAVPPNQVQQNTNFVPPFGYPTQSQSMGFSGYSDTQQVSTGLQSQMMGGYQMNQPLIPSQQQQPLNYGYQSYPVQVPQQQPFQSKFYHSVLV